MARLIKKDPNARTNLGKSKKVYDRKRVSKVRY